MKRGVVFQNTASPRPRTRRKRYGKQWRRPAIAVGYGRHGRHCRFQRSIGRSGCRRSSRRDDATRQSCLQRDRRHWSRSAPRISRGCTGDPGQIRPDRACTIRTRLRAVPRNASAHNLSARNLNARSSSTHIRKQSSSIRPHSFGSDDRHSAGIGDGHSADNGDDEFAPPRSLRMQIAVHSRQRLYAYCLPSCCFGDEDRNAIEGRVIGDDCFAAPSTMGFRGTSGPTALKGRCVAGMWRRNAAITRRYVLMHGTTSPATETFLAGAADPLF